MKTTHAFRLALGTGFLLASVYAWSQTGETNAASGATAMAASDTATAKSIRQENRMLRKKVYAAFAKHKEINAGNISVTAKSGAVTLNGTVAEAAQIEMVAEVTKGVPGVTSVTNKLAAQKPFGGQ